MEGYEIRPDITPEELDDIFKLMLHDYMIYGTVSYIMKPNKTD